MGQRELLTEALRLANENPDAEIHVCAASDELLEDYAWTGHHISKVELGWWHVDGDRIYTDPDELQEVLDDEAYDNGAPPVTEEQARAMMKPAILIYTRA